MSREAGGEFHVKMGQDLAWVLRGCIAAVFCETRPQWGRGELGKPVRRLL